MTSFARFITHAAMKYTFSRARANEYAKTNFRWAYSDGVDLTSFFQFFSLARLLSARASPPLRRDVIVKYDYSVSRRLFLTPDFFSPLFFPSVCARGEHHRSIGIGENARDEERNRRGSNHRRLSRAAISRNSAC